MPDSSTSPRLTRPEYLATMAAAVVVALGILALSLPHAVAAFHSLRGDAVLRKIQDGGTPDVTELTWLVESRRNALAWVNDGRDWTDLALAELLIGEHQAEAGNSDDDYLVRGREALVNGLAAAPANPHAWTRLAYIDLRLHGPSEPVARAIEMSLITARYEPDLLFPRLELGLAAWGSMNARQQEAVLDQIRIADWRWRDELANLAVRSGKPDVIRLALIHDRAARVDFERRYKWRTD